MKIRAATLLFFSIFFVRFVSAACYVNGQEVECNAAFYKSLGLIFAGAIILVGWWAVLWVTMLRDAYKKMSQYPNQFNYKWMLKWVVINIISLGLAAILYYFIVYRKYQKSPETLIQNEENLEDGSIAANRFRKLYFPWSWIANIFFFSFVFGYGDGGRLKIQNSKLIFEPHPVNFPGGYREIELNEINNVTLSLGVNNKVKQMFVNTESSKDRFIIWESQKDDFIKALKQNKVKIIREDE